MTEHAHVDEHFAGSNKLFTSIWVWLVVLTTTFGLPDLRPQAPGGLHYVIQTKGLFPTRP